MKVLLVGDWGNRFWPRLHERFPDIDFVLAELAEDVEREVRDAEVVFGYLTGSQFQTARKLRWIQSPDAGVEKLFQELPDIADTDVAVTNARGAGAPQIGEHAVALMLMFSRGLDRLMRLQRERRWDIEYGLSIVRMLAGRTVGIIGFGHSGREIAWRCRALGTDVLAVDRHYVDGKPMVQEVWKLDRLGELLERSDFVVVTVPQTPDTENMIGAEELARMKPTAYLIATSRGRIVEHEELVDALKHRRIAGAGLDVLAEEPLPPDDELWDLDNVVITPHVAGNSPELYDWTYRILEDNLDRYTRGWPLMNVVDKRLQY